MQVLYSMLPVALKAQIENRLVGGVSRPFSQSSIAFGSVVSLTQSGTGNQTYSTTLSSHSGHCESTLTNTHPHTERQSYDKYGRTGARAHTRTQLQYTKLLPITWYSLFHFLFLFLSFCLSHTTTHSRQLHSDLSLSFTCSGQ